MSGTTTSYILYRLIRSDGKVISAPQTPLASLQIDQPYDYHGWQGDMAGNYTGAGGSLSVTYIVQAMGIAGIGDPPVRVLGCTLVGEVLQR